MRRFWIGLGILFVLLVAGILALNLWVYSYLRSEGFRKLVAAKTGQALKADAAYQAFDWTGSSVFSQSLTAQGESGTPIESLDAEQVRANVDWKAIFHGAWRVERIDVVRLDMKIRSEGQQAATAGQPGPTPEPQPPRRGLLPNRFELDRVDVQNANIAIGAQANIRGTAVRMRPEGNGWLFDGSGGTLDLVSRQPLEIGSFRVRLQQGAVYLTDSELHLGANGNLKVSGEVGGPDAPYDVTLEWQNVDSSDVLDATWKNRVSGILSGKARSLGRAGLPPLTTGNFLLTDGLLTGLPVQKEIAQFTRSPQFERMPLQQVSGDFTYDGAATVVKNFVAESQGLLRLEGNFRVGGNGALDGAFRIGVTSQSLQWLPGSQEKVFTTSENGYLWTTIKIGGNLQTPTEDLSARLAQAMGEQIIDTGVELIQGAPSNAVDAVQKAVDILSPLIP
jgi:hypothetical protein